MRKFIILLCSAFLFCACSTSRDARDKSNTADVKADAGNNDKAVDKKANDQAKTNNDGNADRLRIFKAENFTLVMKNSLKPLKSVTPTIAAHYIESALVTGYEGKRTEQTWYIRIDGIIEINAEKAYDMVAGQADDIHFKPVIHGAITESGGIYIYEGSSWNHFGNIDRDAAEPVEIK